MGVHGHDSAAALFSCKFSESKADVGALMRRLLLKVSFSGSGRGLGCGSTGEGSRDGGCRSKRNRAC